MFKFFQEPLRQLEHGTLYLDKALIQARLTEALEPATATRYTFIPAAAGSTDGTLDLGQVTPEQMIRGGAGAGKGGTVVVVPMVDVVAWMLKSFSNRDYVFVKMAIEGAEQGILRRLLSEKRGDIIDLMAWQCHQSKDAADTSCRDLDADLMRETKIMTIKDQTQVGSFFYEGWDSFSTPDLLFPVTPVRAPAELVEALNSPRLVQLEPHLKAFDQCTDDCSRAQIWRLNMEHAATMVHGHAERCKRDANAEKSSAFLLRIQRTGATGIEKTYGEGAFLKTGFWDFSTLELAKAGAPAAKLVAVLRDPLERALSEYVHRQKTKGCCSATWDFGPACAAEIGTTYHKDLDTYFRSPCGVVRNRQVAMLAGFPRRVDAEETTGVQEVSADVPFDWEKDGAKLLAMAKKNLDSLDGFGFTECLEASVKEMNLRLGLKLVLGRNDREQMKSVMKFAPADRAAELGEEKQRWASFVSAEARATVEDLNRLDRELYAYALARYEAKYGKRCEPAPAPAPTLCSCIPPGLRKPACRTVPGTVRTIADAYQEMPVTAVQDAVDALDVWANFDQLLSHKRSSSAVLLGSAPSLSKIKDATWQTISANSDTWTMNNAIIFASVVPIRFAHIEMNKLWAYKSAERNWIEDCNAKGRKTSLEQLSGTALITNRLHDCRVHRDDGDRMECTMKPGMEEIVHHPSKNEIVGTLARFGRMFTYERAQRWYPESDQKAWCKMNSTAMRWPREGELLRSCGASLTLVLDLLFHMQYERVYFLGFEMTSQEHFWQRDPRFQHLNWHKDLLTLEKKNETHKTAIEAVDKYVVDFGHFNNVDYFSCDRRSLFVKRGMPCI
jgi:hypothetical protein